MLTSKSYLCLKSKAREEGRNQSERETSITLATGSYNSAMRDSAAAISPFQGALNVDSNVPGGQPMCPSRSTHTTLLHNNPFHLGNSGSSGPSRSIHLRAGPTTGVVFHRAMNKSTQMATVIVSSFVILWAPHYVQYFFETTQQLLDLSKQKKQWLNVSSLNESEEMIDTEENSTNEGFFTNWLYILGISYTILNPVIYGLFSLNFFKRRYLE